MSLEVVLEKSFRSVDPNKQLCLAVNIYDQFAQLGEVLIAILEHFGVTCAAGLQKNTNKEKARGPGNVDCGCEYSRTWKTVHNAPSGPAP